MKQTVFVVAVVLLFVSTAFGQDTLWTRKYNGPGSLDDVCRTIALSPTGVIYVAGEATNSSGNTDFVIIAYNPAGDTLWLRQYNGPGNSSDNVVSMTTDGSGNVYVTGNSTGSGTSFDYATIKYAPNGDTIWLRRYNGIGNGIDFARAIVVDDSGNGIVTGGSTVSANRDIVTLKYSPVGLLTWVAMYAGSGDGTDGPFAAAVDDSGNIFVAGSSREGTIDAITIKYKSNGDTAWVRLYNGAAGTNNDAINALVLDDSGNVYVAGYSEETANSDLLVIKYAANGDVAWKNTYDGPLHGEDKAIAMTIDQNFNVYVAGEAVNDSGTRDYVTIKYGPSGDTAWVRRYNYQDTIETDQHVKAIAVDDSGRVYVTGYVMTTMSENDWFTVTYGSSGNELSVRRFSGPGTATDDPWTIAVDAAYNVYVTGSVTNGNGNTDCFTIKYGKVIKINHAPIFAGVSNKTVQVEDTLIFKVQATDQDNDFLMLTCLDTFPNATFVDSGNGAGSFTFMPDTTQDSTFFVDFIVSDSFLADTLLNVRIDVFGTGCQAKPGDANASGGVNLTDIVYLVNYVFKGGAVPVPVCRGDANASGTINLTDIVYLVNYVFKGGAKPIPSGICCLPVAN